MNKKQLLNEILSTLKEKETQNPFTKKIDEVYELNAKIMGAFGGFLTVFKDLVNPLTKKIDTLIAMQRELINAVKGKEEKVSRPSAEDPKPTLFGDVYKAQPKEKDLFSRNPQRFHYGDGYISNDTAVQALVANDLLPRKGAYKALASAVKKMNLQTLPSKSKDANAKGKYRIRRTDLQKIGDFFYKNTQKVR